MTRWEDARTGAGIVRLCPPYETKCGQEQDSETNGNQETTQGAQDASQQQGQEQQETQQGQSQAGGEAPDYEKQIAERDEKIASLEAQVTEAAKNAETAERLRGEIAEHKAQSESDRIDFKLAARRRAQREGGTCPARRPRQIGALPMYARAGTPVPSRYGHARGHVRLTLEAWTSSKKPIRLFEAGRKHAKGGGAGSCTTGLPNAGAASDEGKKE